MVFFGENERNMNEYINKVINGDCIEVLKQLPTKSIDLIVTDPPYGVELDYDVYVDTEENWYKLMNEFIPEAQRVATMVIMPSMQIKRLRWIYENHTPDWLIAWYKGSPGHVSYIGFNDWEPLLVYGKPKGLSMHDYFYAQPKPFDNGHPCPKPIEWAEWLITRASKKNELVLDPFGGSGTTAVAAIRTNRNFILIEQSAEYCAIAEKRIKEERNKLAETCYVQDLALFGNVSQK